jgi:hypothetical protein
VEIVAQAIMGTALEQALGMEEMVDHDKLLETVLTSLECKIIWEADHSI